MHKFPPAKELQFLVGKEIEQICLDPWSLQFRFDDRGQITVESKIEHTDQSGVTQVYECGDRAKPLCLHDLLQQRITMVDADDFNLILSFDKGSRLRILTDEGQYECGQIYGPDRTECLVVF